MQGIDQTALFELRARGLPSRSSTEQRLVRVAGLAPALAKVWASCLFIGLHAVLADGHRCPRSDSHRHCARFKCAVSALDYVGKLVPREGFPLWWPCASTLSVLRGASLV